jgi:hypothetical protein
MKFVPLKTNSIMQATITTNQGNGSDSLIFTVVLAWGLAAFAAGYFEWFTALPRPLFGVTVALIQLSFIVLYFKNSWFKNYSNNISLKSIALFHSWRIFAGWIFLSFEDNLSATFIQNAAWGDIISGFLGISVFIFGHRVWSYWLFNVVGMLDFILAVGTGLTLTILNDAGMEPIVHLPLIMIPLFGVPLSGLTHIISITRLFQGVKVASGEN